MTRTGRHGRDTRGDILEAARSSFADRGYDRTTIRSVAAQADVDPALVMHYFGSKKALFTEAMELPFDPGVALREVLHPLDSTAGERLVRFFLENIEVGDRSTVALVRSGLGSDEGIPLLRSFVETEIVETIAGLIRGRDRRLRASLIATHLIGTSIGRYLVRIDPLATVDEEALVRAISPAIQNYLLP
ncbi:MAG: hypothetical protein JJLCMIEE_00702 [Acidimicrobiales bacterium]|nr:MAG: TetR/AcrR family transcriptional regulator [Actinomycetota bacterium]MBV6507647.1 hypothetical protein [Acidimicrobiales bacterium]RIK07578.1 MAG: TetR family transcriptional regulator [Acidobacteriota bacterium]